jgi:hypothetical protein
MKHSQDVQDHATGTEIYHLDADVERGPGPGSGRQDATQYSALLRSGRVLRPGATPRRWAARMQPLASYAQYSMSPNGLQ